jgi:hypothetical protein
MYSSPRDLGQLFAHFGQLVPGRQNSHQAAIAIGQRRGSVKTLNAAEAIGAERQLRQIPRRFDCEGISAIADGMFAVPFLSSA